MLNYHLLHNTDFQILDRRRLELLAYQVSSSSFAQVHPQSLMNTPLTNSDFEWHDPSVPTTKDGHLLITMSEENIHDLNLKSGMIQSWNQLCFNKNAIFEVSASLPGTSDVGGFWPGVWTMGNLGRAGYGGTNEGRSCIVYSANELT
jgi:beta-glucanase (GH16 family)